MAKATHFRTSRKWTPNLTPADLQQGLDSGLFRAVTPRDLQARWARQVARENGARKSPLKHVRAAQAQLDALYKQVPTRGALIRRSLGPKASRPRSRAPRRTRRVASARAPSRAGPDPEPPPPHNPAGAPVSP